MAICVWKQSSPLKRKQPPPTRVRIVAPKKMISMLESEDGDTRTVAADAVLTGSVGTVLKAQKMAA
jgi:hypothetical protein